MEGTEAAESSALSVELYLRPPPANSSSAFISGPFNSWSASPSDNYRVSPDTGKATVSVPIFLLEISNNKLEFKWIVDGIWRTSQGYPVNEAFGGGNNVVDLTREVVEWQGKRKLAQEAAAAEKVLQERRASMQLLVANENENGELAGTEEETVGTGHAADQQITKAKHDSGVSLHGDDEQSMPGSFDSDAAKKADYVEGNQKEQSEQSEPSTPVSAAATAGSSSLSIDTTDNGIRGRIHFTDGGDSATPNSAGLNAPDHPPSWRSTPRPRSISTSSTTSSRSVFDLAESERRELARRHEIERRKKEDKQEVYDWTVMLAASLAFLVLAYWVLLVGKK